MHQSNRIRLELFTASFLVLFQELILIRWLPGQVRVLAYFPNLILLSAFLGLGIGCLRAEKKSLLWFWPISLVLLVGVAHLGSHIAFTQNSISEHLWLLYHDLPENALVVKDIKLPIILGFLLSSFTFIPLGQIVADRLQQFNKTSSSLWGYCWDILGSLAGVATFTALGFFGTFPVMWFSLLFVVGLLFFFKTGYSRFIFSILSILICVFVGFQEKASYYSPYYAISYVSENNYQGVKIYTNGSFHQQGLDLANSSVLEMEKHFQVRKNYHLPYEYLEKIPQKALVLGAGSGNDVAVLLDEGAPHIDAVEIDPVIIQIGEDLHPNKPYSSDRVHIFNTDARSLLNSSKEKYDLIVFGTLDSQTRLSALSNVRLDNFIYTIECIQSAQRLLTEDGGIVMYFSVHTPYIHTRIISLLTECFDQVPMVISLDDNILFNKIYMAGPAFSSHDGEQRKELVSDFQNNFQKDLPNTSDDWPYLYLEKRGISAFYLLLIGIILIISVAFIFASSREMRHSLLSPKYVDAQMFLFGLAFLLLETRYITQMNLIWGATWITSAVVFGSILLTILLSTILTKLRPIPIKISMTLLILSLLGTYFLPIELLLRQGFVLKLLSSVVVVGVPIFFAGASFAHYFAKRERADIAFGWNLIGAVVGGLAEFLSMLVGLNALLLIAVVVYATSTLFSKTISNRETSSSSPNEEKEFLTQG